MSPINFVSVVEKFSTESEFKWTINSVSDLAVPRGFTLTSGEVNIKGLESRWFMTIQKFRPTGLIYRTPEQRNVCLVAKFYVRDYVSDKNGSYRFIVNVNGSAFHSTTAVTNNSGGPLVLEAVISNTFSVHMETDSVKIKAKCLYDTVSAEVDQVMDYDMDETDYGNTVFKNGQKNVKNSYRKENKDAREDGEQSTTSRDLHKKDNELDDDREDGEPLATNSKNIQRPKDLPSTKPSLFISSVKTHENPISDKWFGVGKAAEKPSEKSLTASASSLSSSSSLSNLEAEKSSIYKSSSSESLNDTDDEFEDELIADFQSANLRITKRIKKIYLEKMRHIAETSSRWLVGASRVSFTPPIFYC